MGLILDDSSNQYARSGTTPIEVPDFTVSMWVRLDGTGGSTKYFFYTEAEGVGINFRQALLQYVPTAAGDPLRVFVRRNFTTATNDYDTDGDWPDRVWVHVVGVFNRIPLPSLSYQPVPWYRGARGENVIKDFSGAGDIDELDIIALGANDGGSASTNGTIAEVGLWDTTLSQAQIEDLAAGLKPSSVAEGNLKAYWPLLSDGVDQVGSYDLVLPNGGTYDGEDHPHVTRKLDLNRAGVLGVGDCPSYGELYGI